MFVDFGEETINLDQVISIRVVVSNHVIDRYDEERRVKTSYQIEIFSSSRTQTTFEFNSKTEMDDAYHTLVRIILDAKDLDWKISK